MRLEYATANAVYSAALAMRETDYDEFLALSTAADRPSLALLLANRYANRPDVVVAFDGDDAVAVGGLVEHRPHVVTLLFFATGRFDGIAAEMTRMVHNLLRGAKAVGVHRVEAVSMVGHDGAHRWIRHLGLEPEGQPMRGYGRGGEAYQQFAWVSDDCPPGA